MPDFLKQGTASADTQNPDEGDETSAGGAQETAGGFDFVELPPTGEYETVCMSAVYGTSKNSGAQQWTLQLACPELPAANAKYYLTNTPGGAWRVHQDLQTFGLPVPEKGKTSPTYQASDFVGKKVIATAVHDRWQGRLTFKFNAIKPTPEGPGARAFAAE